MSSASRPGSPTLGVFAPGRVNLIGEHIDYHGLAVLPMALERGIRIRFRPGDDARVRLVNEDPSFPTCTFDLDPELEPGPLGDWGNYAMAGARAVVRRYGVTRGIEGRVTSDLPPAAGLSSSSALVVAVARALLAAADLDPHPLELARVLAEGERFVGTAGGGMDQAASLCGRVGHALHMGFDPLSVEPIPIPEGWTILVAYSGVRAEKSARVREEYNRRRRVGEEGVRELARRSGLPGAPASRLLAELGGSELLARVDGLPGEAARWLRHVVSEARRVDEAVADLRAGELARFGALLSASHASLRDDYRVSHPALDRLVEAAEATGAAGARLTGAGFGGSVVAVCDARRMDGLLAALWRVQAELGVAPVHRAFRAHPGAAAPTQGRISP